MAMPLAHQQFVVDSSYEARVLLERLGPLLQLDVLWAGAANYDGLIDQASIDTVPNFAEADLTETDLADAEFALATIKSTLSNALPALTKLAKLPNP